MIVEKKAAGRAVLGSVFFLSAAFLLWSIAVGSYVIFYLSYIPVRGFSLPVYLQFDQGLDLYASLHLPEGRLVSGQPYDVKLHLYMPQTATNAAAGNFMLDLQLLRPASLTWSKTTEKTELVAASRRPAILTYYSPLIQHAHNFVALPLYILGWRKESERLVVSLLEDVEFARGWQNIPTEARIKVQSSNQLQIYSAKLTFKTRLKGLR
jgi:seipin